MDDIEQVAGSPGFQALRDLSCSAHGYHPGTGYRTSAPGPGLLALAAAPCVARVHRTRLLFGHARRWGSSSAAVESKTSRCRSTTRGRSRWPTTPLMFLSNLLFPPPKRRGQGTRIGRDQTRSTPRRTTGIRRHDVSSRHRQSPRPVGDHSTHQTDDRHGWPGAPAAVQDAVLIASRRWEHPASVEWWRKALTDAGFNEVAVSALEHEAGNRARG